MLLFALIPVVDISVPFMLVYFGVFIAAMFISFKLLIRLEQTSEGTDK